MLCFIAFCFRGDSDVLSKKEQHVRFSDINPFDHRILGVVSLKGDYQVPENVGSKIQRIKDGSRMCVLVKSGKDQFVGYLEEDPFRSLVRFPMELCRTDPNWLAKKWAQMSQDSGYEEDYTTTTTPTSMCTKNEEIIPYKLNVMSHTTTSIPVEDNSQFTQVDLTN
ncbi:hypothetical protein K7432_002630 [Basidiobolus ranarum]|uniref:Uncharacterized protein n=1 Tax=Basidiobolus ranarum TaxID=34480 RepID=A0ABR2X198_9FUNG